MEANYSHWINQNPGKNLEDYKQEVCIPEDEIKPEAPVAVKQKKKIKAGRWIGIAAGVLIVVVAGFFTIKIVQHYLFPSLQKYAGSEWAMQDCGTLGLQISTPIELKSDHSLQKQLEHESVTSIDQIETYVARTFNDNLFIMANSFRYTSGTEASLKGAVEGSLREMKQRPGITGFKFDVSGIKKYDLNGALIKGKWKKNDSYTGFWQAIFVKKNVVWQILVGFDLTDPYGEKIADKIIQSINITPNIAQLLIGGGKQPGDQRRDSTSGGFFYDIKVCDSFHPVCSGIDIIFFNIGPDICQQSGGRVNHQRCTDYDENISRGCNFNGRFDHLNRFTEPYNMRT